jgi:hypothetical protein
MFCFTDYRLLILSILSQAENSGSDKDDSKQDSESEKKFIKTSFGLI